jgi:hypothetical protein
MLELVRLMSLDGTQQVPGQLTAEQSKTGFVYILFHLYLHWSLTAFGMAEAPLLLFHQLEMTIQNGDMRELFEVHHEYEKKSYAYEKEGIELLHQRLV